MKTFEDLLDKLEEKTMAQIVEGTMVECIENEVYEDDELTEEDEAKIAQAIADLTDADSIKKILDKVDKIM